MSTDFHGYRKGDYCIRSFGKVGISACILAIGHFRSKWQAGSSLVESANSAPMFTISRLDAAWRAEFVSMKGGSMGWKSVGTINWSVALGLVRMAFAVGRGV